MLWAGLRSQGDALGWIGSSLQDSGVAGHGRLGEDPAPGERRGCRRSPVAGANNQTTGVAFRATPHSQGGQRACCGGAGTGMAAEGRSPPRRGRPLAGLLHPPASGPPPTPLLDVHVASGYNGLRETLEEHGHVDRVESGAGQEGRLRARAARAGLSAEEFVSRSVAKDEPVTAPGHSPQVAAILAFAARLRAGDPEALRIQAERNDRLIATLQRWTEEDTADPEPGPVPEVPRLALRRAQCDAPDG